MKNILILGGGESGVGTALLAKKHGLTCRVSDSATLRDSFRRELERAEIPYEEGGHDESLLRSASLVVKSPGIPDGLPMIQALRARGCEVISEIEFAYRLLPASGRPTLVGITGSNGKTTSVGWLTHLLQCGGVDAVQCGNVGHSFARLLAEEQMHACYCIELSSFQLDGMPTFHPDVALLLNITADHLDRYDHKIENYARSKVSLARNLVEGDLLVSWADCDLSERFLPYERTYTTARFTSSSTPVGAPAAFVDGDDLCFVDESGRLLFRFAKSRLALAGEHNLLNAMAVTLAALHLGVSTEALERGLSDFRNVPHRLEHIADIDGVSYINDSKATNIDSARYALGAQTRPVVLILGGTDKGNDYTDIAHLVKEKCKALIYLGVDNTKLHAAFDRLIPETKEAHSMQECIALAHAMSEAGDVVLLSPCCASFDLFNNYEDRGDQFRHYVQTLASQTDEHSLGI